MASSATPEKLHDLLDGADFETGGINTIEDMNFSRGTYNSDPHLIPRIQKVTYFQFIDIYFTIVFSSIWKMRRMWISTQCLMIYKNYTLKIMVGVRGTLSVHL